MIGDVFTLYRILRTLATEITRGALPVPLPTGIELAELRRRLDCYGPWQQNRGHMSLDLSGQNYRRTWKAQSSELGAPSGRFRTLRCRRASTR
jgi:hypothetical protein